jgi:hypothetical protein
VNARNRDGCAVSACGDRRECGGRVPAAVCRAVRRRCTKPRPMAHSTPSPSCCCAAPAGPSRPNTAGNAALRRTAEPKPQQPRACRWTPKQCANVYGRLARYEAAEWEVHSARRLPPPAHPPSALRPIPLRAAGADGSAVGARRRRSPIQRAGRRSPTQHSHVTDALAARLVVHYCTRGSRCRAHRARAAAADGGSAKHCCGGTGTERTVNLARATRRSASWPLRLPTQPTVGLGAAVQSGASGKDGGASTRRARRSAQ